MGWSGRAIVGAGGVYIGGLDLPWIYRCSRTYRLSASSIGAWQITALCIIIAYTPRQTSEPSRKPRGGVGLGRVLPRMLYEVRSVQAQHESAFLTQGALFATFYNICR